MSRAIARMSGRRLCRFSRRASRSTASAVASRCWTAIAITVAAARSRSCPHRGPDRGHLRTRDGQPVVHDDVLTGPQPGRVHHRAVPAVARPGHGTITWMPSSNPCRPCQARAGRPVERGVVAGLPDRDPAPGPEAERHPVHGDRLVAVGPASGRTRPGARRPTGPWPHWRACGCGTARRPGSGRGGRHGRAAAREEHARQGRSARVDVRQGGKRPACGQPLRQR